MRNVLCAGALILACAMPLAAQEEATPDANDPVLLLGLSVQDLLKYYGPPLAVHAVRGNSTWQDDVVFEYRAAEFYLYRDRVWQLALKQANGVKMGDAKMTVALAHGSAAEDYGTYMLVVVPHRAWPVVYRYNIDTKGRVSAIYLYRADY